MPRLDDVGATFEACITPGILPSALLELKPVTFRYRQADERGQKPVQIDLIAEDVAKVLPELVVYDHQSRAETVAYQMLSSLLLNEFQQEHLKLNAVAAQAAAPAADAQASRQQLTSMRELAAERDRELTAMRVEVERLKLVSPRLMAERASRASVAAIEC